MSDLATLNRANLVRAGSGEFLMLTRCLLQGRGRPADAAVVAKAAHATPRVLGILEKGAVPGGDATTPGWASELSDYRAIAAAFIATMPGFSAFDKIYGDGSFVRMPLKVRISIGSTSGTAAGVISALAPVPIGEMSIAGTTLEPVAIGGGLAITDELAMISSAAANSLLGDTLREAVGVATDEKFISLITEGTDISSSASTGLGATQIVADLQDALAAIDIRQRSKLYIIMPGNVASVLALTRDAGGWLFPQLTPTGGSIQGVPVAITNAVDDKILIVDGSQIAAEQEALTYDVATHATLQLDNAPSSGAQQVISLWQNNLRGLRVRRWFGCQLLRSTAVAIISDVTTSA